LRPQHVVNQKGGHKSAGFSNKVRRSANVVFFSDDVHKHATAEDKPNKANRVGSVVSP
jgi:hypothetical protein